MCLSVNCSNTERFLDSVKDKTDTVVYKILVKSNWGNNCDYFTPYRYKKVSPGKNLERKKQKSYEISRQNVCIWSDFSDLQEKDRLKEGGIHIYFDKETGIKDLEEWIDDLPVFGNTMSFVMGNDLYVLLVKCYAKKDDFIVAGINDDGIFKKIFIPSQPEYIHSCRIKWINSRGEI